MRAPATLLGRLASAGMATATVGAWELAWWCRSRAQTIPDPLALLAGDPQDATWPVGAFWGVARNRGNGAVRGVTGPDPGSCLLYGQASDGSWVFADRLAGITNVCGLPDLDLPRLVRLYARGPADAIPLAGIHCLDRGRALVVAPSSLAQRRTWLKFDDAPRRGDPEEFVAEYLDVLARVTDELLPDSGDVSALMSAGLDSTMVVAAAAAEMGPDRQVVAMCYQPAEPPRARARWIADDFPTARAMSMRWPNVCVEPLREDSRPTPIDIWDRVGGVTGLPLPAPSSAQWLDLAYSRAAARGHRVMLCGQSGNNVFSPDRWQALPALVRTRPGVVIPALRARAAARGESMWQQARFLVGTALRDVPIPALERRYASRLPRLDDWPFRPQAITALGLARESDALDRWRASRRLQARRPTSFVPDEAARTMALDNHGVSTLDPLGCEPLVRIAARLPDEAFVGVGDGRSFARRAMADLVPDEIRLRSGRGLQPPDAGAYRDRQDLLGRFAELAGNSVVADLLEIESMRAELGKLVAGRPGRAAALNRGLALALYVVWHAEVRKTAALGGQPGMTLS